MATILILNLHFPFTFLNYRPMMRKSINLNFLALVSMFIFSAPTFGETPRVDDHKSRTNSRPMANPVANSDLSDLLSAKIGPGQTYNIVEMNQTEISRLASSLRRGLQEMRILTLEGCSIRSRKIFKVFPLDINKPRIVIGYLSFARTTCDDDGSLFEGWAPFDALGRQLREFKNY